MSAPTYRVSKSYGLLRTDTSPYPGYGRPTNPAAIIKLAAARHAQRSKEQAK